MKYKVLEEGKFYEVEADFPDQAAEKLSLQLGKDIYCNISGIEYSVEFTVDGPVAKVIFDVKQ